MDNINFYSNWIPAWQQTDSYTTQPWCLLSKNVDIFSSSKSIKATAFSEPVAQAQWAWIVDVDEKWRLELHENGKIWDNEANSWAWGYILDPATNFPSYPVSYTWASWEATAATFGTPQKLMVKYEWDDWRSLVVFTDRTQYNYSKVKYALKRSWWSISWFTIEEWFDDFDKWTKINKSWTWSSWYITFVLESEPFSEVDLKISCTQSSSSATNISCPRIMRYEPNKYVYDAELDSMSAVDNDTQTYFPNTEPIFEEEWTEKVTIIKVKTRPAWRTVQTYVRVYFQFDLKEWESTRNWAWDLYVDICGRKWQYAYNDYYSYLYPADHSDVKQIWDYYWMKWITQQPLYTWWQTWIETEDWDKKIRYDLIKSMAWENDINMDIVTLIEYKERVYMIGNMNGNWYIIPCDLSWGKWVATMFPWVQFLGGINKDYLIYLCWTDRWVSTLWAYNWQELVPVISWSQEINSKDLVDYVEQYRFDGSMVIYRNNLVLGTTDNRLFRYWQTYWGRWGSFIYVLPDWATLDKLEARNNDLIIHYTLNQVKYTTVYQDDVPVQRFNTEYEVVYPIVIWNHILEKEDTDLYVSYLLPSANTSLEFWAMNNHYQYWTFTSEENVTLDTTKSYTMAWAWGTYALKFIERNWNQYTFELDGNLPVQTSNEMKIKDNENTVVLNYTSYNHFRLIWTLSTDKCEESKFRFTGLNNKLNLTKTHSMQIMVKGKWTTQYTPELFALNLVATQRDRW